MFTHKRLLTPFLAMLVALVYAFSAFPSVALAQQSASDEIVQETEENACFNENTAEAFEENIVNSSEKVQKVERELNAVLVSNKFELGSPVEIAFDKSDIVSYTYETDGVAVVDLDREAMQFQLSVEEEFGKITVHAQYADGATATSSLYTYKCDDAVFVSEYAKDDAWLQCMEAKYEQGLISLEEIDEAYGKLSLAANKEGFGFIPLPEETVYMHVRGTLNWKTEDGDVLPLRQTMVELRRKKSSDSEVLATTYTDDKGTYLFQINVDTWWQLDGGAPDIFIRIYAGSKTFGVAYFSIEGVWDAMDCVYHIDSAIYNDVFPTSTLVINYQFAYDKSVNMNKSIFVQQCMVMAQDFAQTMGMPDNFLCVFFPFKSIPTSFSGELVAGINNESFNDANTIMHEYGHFVEHTMDIYGRTAFDMMMHVPYHNDDNDNLKDITPLKTKKYYMNLTWTEAWSNAFAKVVQQYHQAQFGGKVYSKVNEHESYDVSEKSCEGQINAVSAVLVDLFDENVYGTYTSKEPFDNVAWGYQKWWDITTISGTYYFMDLLKNIDTLCPEERSQVGEILGAHQIAPSEVKVKNAVNVSSTVAPTLSWRCNGSITSPNNLFKVAFYDVNGNLLHETGGISKKCDYQDTIEIDVSPSDWQQVFYKLQVTSVIHIAVKAYNSKNSPTSGPFFSKYVTVLVNILPTKTVTVAEETDYFEDVYYIDIGYIDYVINFEVARYMMFFTTGDKDAEISLYDVQGNLLAYDDNSGYGSNAMINYAVERGVQYRVVISLSNPNDEGKVKFVMIPRTYYYAYEKIPSYTFDMDSEQATMQVTKYTKEVGICRFVTSNYGLITLNTESNFDTSIYVIDPRSTEPMSTLMNAKNVFSNSGSDGQAKLIKNFSANVEYLVIVSTRNIMSDIGVINIFAKRSTLASQTITPDVFGYQNEYVKTETVDLITLPNGYSFATNRFRCGYINDQYLALSAKRDGFDTAYLELHFNDEIINFEFSMALWSAEEYLGTAESFIRVQYLNPDGDWILLKQFDVSTMSKDKDILDMYSFKLPDGVRSVRFYVHTNLAKYSNNKGRVVLGDITIQHYE